MQIKPILFALLLGAAATMALSTPASARPGQNDNFPDVNNFPGQGASAPYIDDYEDFVENPCDEGTVEFECELLVMETETEPAEGGEIELERGALLNCEGTDGSYDYEIVGGLSGGEAEAGNGEITMEKGMLFFSSEEGPDFKCVKLAVEVENAGGPANTPMNDDWQCTCLEPID